MSEVQQFSGRVRSTSKRPRQYYLHVTGQARTDKTEEDILEWMYDQRDAVLVNGIVYCIVAEYNTDSCSDIFFSSKCPNGDYTIVTKFYNGGMGLHEAIERSMRVQYDA